MNPGLKAVSAALLILSVVTPLISGCAKIEYPPGGPEDRTAPEVLATSPQTGTTNVSPVSRVRIDFSEPIDRESVEKAVFISPQPDPPPEINMKRDAIEIVPKADWLENKTYVITLGTDLKDAHNVNLDQSITIAFATGSTIDSGSISGTAYKTGKAARGISIALFAGDPGGYEKPIDSVPPDYLTQSGENGMFAFEFLPPGPFYLVAFEDRNKNRRIDFGREMVGLPFEMAQLSADRSLQANLDLQLHSSDTTIVGFRNVSINSDGLLKLRLTKLLNADKANTLFRTVIVTQADTAGDTVGVFDFAPLSEYPSSDFLFLTGEFTPETQYRLTLDLSSLYPTIDDSLQLITYTFSAQTKEDRTPPIFTSIFPVDGAANIHPESLITLRTSEPLDAKSLNDAVWMIYSEKDTAKIAVTAQSPFRYTGSPANGMGFGREYRWFMIESLVRDRSGNPLGDSVRSYTFSTIGIDTLGSMSGEIHFVGPDDSASPVIVSIIPAKNGAAAEIRVPPGLTQFSAELLPGYYTVSAFIDRNDNGAYDFGSLIPYRLAEPFTVQSDTIRVRTRFESAGVIIEL